MSANYTEMSSSQSSLDANDGDGGNTFAIERILIVDDSEVELLRLQAMLTKLGYDVAGAKNGVEAINILESERISLILSDWRMPELNGIELCQRLRGDETFGQPYFILLTGLDSPEDLVEGMDAGADDFVTKPFNAEELQARLQAGVRTLKLRAQLIARNSELNKALLREEASRKLINRDLEAAAAMQRELLPSGGSPFSELQINSLFLPAATVAGDGLGYFRLDDDHLAFYHFDVAGHGIASAMLSFTLSRFLSPALAESVLPVPEPDGLDSVSRMMRPDRVVTHLNQHFQEQAECDLYFTLVYGVLRVSTGQGALCQAGHPHPILLAADGTVTQIGNGGFPVGMLPGVAYENVPFELSSGDRLILHSDGITDCMSEAELPLGNERMISLLQQTHEMPLETAIKLFESSLQTWRGSRALDDDISMLAIDWPRSSPTLSSIR